MDVASGQNAAELGQWWATAPQLDWDTFADGILQHVNRIHQAVNDEDRAATQELIRLYDLGQTFCQVEPQLSTYEYGQLAICSILAGDHIAKGEYSQAASVLERFHAIYTARMRRYEEQGQPPRRASEARYGFLLSLANLKWIAPEEWRDFLLTPEQVLDQIQETYGHIVQALQANPGIHPNKRNLFDGLALCELCGLKMSLRYAPTRTAGLVQTFNEHHQDNLALATGHHKLVNAVDGECSAYFWDFELAKLRLDPASPAQDIYMCIELRSLAARNTFVSWKYQGLLRNWRAEALVIVRELKARQQAS